MARNPALARSVLLLFIATGTPAAARDLPVEIVPTIGVRGGATLHPDQPGYPPAEAPASISFGLGVNVYVRPDAWVDVSFDRQTLEFAADPAVFGVSRFDVTIDYLQFGGGYEPRSGKFRPFVAAALGLTRYGSDDGTLQETLGLSGSIGGGFKAGMGSRLSLELEILGYATSADAALSVSCGPGCSLQFASSGWYQVAARVGLAIRLGPREIARSKGGHE
jgi:hypothetical protein